jgi:hypothetical protein
MKKLYCLVVVFLLILSGEIFACTSAIFSGKATKDGRPLMWKHRDTGEENNRIEFFKGEKYSFIALMNSPSNTKEAWSGTNEVGFCIMNTASYNLKDDDVKQELMDKEGVLMFKALATCKNLKDFEKFLDEYNQPRGVEANFGVIDAEGGAAYYEVNNNSWKKIDVNDERIAPQGYVVYTNFSYNGRKDEGLGYIRYTTADKLIKDRICRNGEITPKWIMQNLSRSFYHSVLGIDLVKDKELVDKCNGWFIEQDFISRNSSASSIVFEGVKMGENPLNTIMWTILGYPPAGITVPLMVGLKENQPLFMTKSSNSNNAKMCDWVLEKKREIFPIKRGSGKRYFNFYKISEFMKQSVEIENQIFSLSSPIINDIRANKKQTCELKKVYEFVEEKLNF